MDRFQHVLDRLLYTNLGNTLAAFLEEGVLCSKKNERVVFLSEPKNSPGEPASYRTIFLMMPWSQNKGTSAGGGVSGYMTSLAENCL